MIQRIQTLWLFLVSACAFSTLKLSFYSGNKAGTNNIKQFLSLNATTNIFVMIITVTIAMAALVLIFLYKNRKRQLLVTLATFAASIINIVLYFSETRKFIEGNYDITAIISFSIPVFLLLAARGIYKDEKLIKSVDRLR